MSSPAEASWFLFFPKATPITSFLWPFNVYSFLPVFVSQMWMSSAPHDAAQAPSGLKATQGTRKTLNFSLAFSSVNLSVSCPR